MNIDKPRLRNLREYSLRDLLLALTLFGMIGLAVELVLLRHTDSAAKLIPLVALAAGFVPGVLLAVRPSSGIIRAFQLIMVVFLISGLLGLYFHFKGNVEFALERYPSATGMQLAWKALRGATPTLAPGALAQLGLLGLAFTYRHPILRDRTMNDQELTE